MSRKISSAVRQAIWLMMIDPGFRREILSGRVGAAVAKKGIKCSTKDLAQLRKLDSGDLNNMLARLESEMVVSMGGSRPRTMVMLSDATITELKKSLHQK